MSENKWSVKSSLFAKENSSNVHAGSSSILSEPYAIQVEEYEAQVEELTALVDGYFDRLWPLLRSITGDGVRETHRILGEVLPLETVEVPSGSKVCGWTVPQEWKCSAAYILDSDGQRVVDMEVNNLHVVNYSEPVDKEVSLEELQEHLYSWEHLPEAIPYVTSYYRRTWGFCMTHTQRETLKEGTYRVVIESELFDGSLTYSYATLEGESDEVVVLNTNTCHPSLANNELAGPLCVMAIYVLLSRMAKRRYTYVFSFVPETIGAATILAEFGETWKEKMVAGYQVICCGIKGGFTLKESWSGQTLADRAAREVISHWGYEEEAPEVIPYFPDGGSDERFFGSPGFRLPFASVMRGMYGRYREYHCSLDDKTCVSMAALADSAMMYAEICRTIERNVVYVNTEPKGEPQLGPRGLYPSQGGMLSQEDKVYAIMWLCNMCDGQTDLLAIAERANLSTGLLEAMAEKCAEKGLLVEVQEG